MRAGGDNGPWAGARASLASAGRSPVPALGSSAPPRGWRASAPGLRLGRPRSSPAARARTARGAGAGCATTPLPGTRRPGAGSAAQVTYSGPGLGGSGRAWGSPARTPVPAVSRVGAGIRGGCGAPERERNFGVTSPNTLLPRGQRDTGTMSSVSLAPSRPLLPLVSPIRTPGTPTPILAGPSPVWRWQGLLGTCGPRRPTLSPELCPSGCSAAPRTWQAG